MICHNLFIHSLAEGHLSYFQFLASINNAAMNMHEQVFVWTYGLFLLGIYLRVGLLGYRVTLCLTYWGTCQNSFPKARTILYSLQWCVSVTIILHPYQYLLFIFLIVVILVSMKLYLIVVLICMSLMANNIAIISYTFSHLFIIFKRKFIQILCHLLIE